MIDRQKLETLLSRRFAGATPQQIAAAANAIVGLEKDGETVQGRRKSGRRHEPSRTAQEKPLAVVLPEVRP